MQEIENNFQRYKSESEKKVQELSEQNEYMAEQVTDLRFRSMKNNLVFSGIPENAWDKEDTEGVLRDFSQNSLTLIIS